jgi:cytochrome c oxidase subunit 4
MSDHSNHPAAAPSHGPITRLGELPAHSVAEAHGLAGHAAEDASHDGHGAEDGHGDIGKYLLVFLALCALTTMSFFTTSSLWPWKSEPHVGWAFMMAVSCTKALLVVLVFMHVLWEANWKYVLTIPAAMMAIFLAIMLIPDVGLRTRMVAQEREIHMARPSDVRLLEQAGEAQLLSEPAGAH